MSALEREMLLRAFDSNWIAPVGPDLVAFEEELGRRAGGRSAVALSSGTAALHLALLGVGVRPGDSVLVSDLTFAASVNAIVYCGAAPVFIDSEWRSWNMDPDLLADELEERCEAGRLPAAVVVVDLYGQCARYEEIAAICERHDVPLVADAAEAVGASHAGRPAGSFGRAAAFSFNGNKLITTGGGGALVSADEELVGRARYLATQARLPFAHYEHEEVGYNYRLSNLLAAIGRAQLRRLDEKIAARAALRSTYMAELAGLPGVAFNPIDASNTVNHWLTCITIDLAESGGVVPEAVRLALVA